MSFKKSINLAIVGATGIVGRKFLEVLSERNFPIENLYLFSSYKSAGTKIIYDNKEYIVEELTEQAIKSKKIDIALFSAGGKVSKKFAPTFAAQKCIVIDNSSCWRMDKNVPLIVPEVNSHAIDNHNYIIANPNCSTIQAVMILAPLNRNYKIKRVVYSTYQAVSGAGKLACEDLINGRNGITTTKKFQYPIFDNCIPQIDSFILDGEYSGYTKEEVKMIEETRKILEKPNLAVTATTIRVPIMNSHSESINVEFEEDFELEELINLLRNQSGVIVEDDIQKNIYPMAINANNRDEVFVGRIRRDRSVKFGVNLWVVADNIRKGAATNAVQIAQQLINNF